MDKYITTAPTDWYTTSGAIGNTPSKKLQTGYTFDSDNVAVKRGVDCRNVIGWNMWIPSSVCKKVTETPPPDEPPDTGDNEDEEVVILIDRVDGSVKSITVDGKPWGEV
jgi:hypothetical protein